MINEVLPASAQQRASIINAARDMHPALAAENPDAEQILHTFHQLGTSYSPPLDLEIASTIEGYIALFAGIEPMPLLEFEDLGPDHFTHYDNYVRGGFRILGTFPPNPRMAQFAPETQTYFLAGIPVSTQDYHIPDGTRYYPPVFNLHKLMFRVTTDFDARYELATSREDVTKAIAAFYFWGLTMLHPYLGANHRAFDRFLEYAYFKKGFEVKTPLDHTVNIPPQTRFNLEMYKERQRLLQEANLKDQTFPHKGFSIYDPKWLTYQTGLNEFIIDCLNNQQARTEEIADALFSWR